MNQDKNYHHGNLRNDLIEAGIEIVSEKGEKELSLRKIAAKCNVSQAAPYAHFQSKEDLINAIQEYITDEFLKFLKASQENVEAYSDKAIYKMGEAYISFFIEHPFYFRFMFQTPYMKIYISLEESQDNFPPYEIFRKMIIGNLKRHNVDEKEYMPKLINAWATVQGITMLATQENVIYEKDWKEDIGRILRNE